MYIYLIENNMSTDRITNRDVELEQFFVDDNELSTIDTFPEKDLHNYKKTRLLRSSIYLLRILME